MQDFRFYAPTEVIFGKNSVKQIGSISRKYGSKALLVYGGGSVVKSGLLSGIKDLLDTEGVAYEEFGGAKPNPTYAHAKTGVKKAVDFGADLIIGIGGGSAIDTAKAIAHGSANPTYDLWDIWTKKVPLERSIPVGAVLTIPAAGSEMSDSAVLTNEELGKKSGINTDQNRCAFAIMDPTLGATIPKYQLAAGITDIMMHTMERYFIPGIQCDLTDELAEGLLRTVIKNAERVIKDPSDYDAMSEIFWASSLSHNGLTECGRGRDFSVHKLGHALSAKYDVTHGASLSAVWGAWAKELYMDCLSRFSQFAKKVWGIEGSDEASVSLEGIERTLTFFSSIGMPVNLKELGVTPNDNEIHELAMLATMDDSMKLSRIRPLGAVDVEKIYREVLN